MSYRRESDWENADRLKGQAAEIGIELRAYKSENGVNGGQASLKSNDIDVRKVDALK
jgi:cysteinyl-tRNA synthetase